MPPHKRFAHRHALEPDYSGYGWSFSPNSGLQPLLKEHHLLIVFLSVFFDFSLKQNVSGKKQ